MNASLRTTLRTTGNALQTAFDAMNEVAQERGVQIETVSVSVGKTNLAEGTVKGTVTVQNRSRRPFAIQVTGDNVILTFLGLARKVA